MSTCSVILAHVIWVLTQEWALFQNSYMGTYPGVGACLGPYGMYIMSILLLDCN